jgi:ribosomal protein S18 acetylase RimI-like enzyme
MIAIRKARPADAIAIGAVHVAAWRSAYPGILPDRYLARLSVSRQAAHYDAAIRGGTGVLVAIASGDDVGMGGGTRIIGFSTAGAARTREISGQVLGDGEVETLYVLDDWRDRGVGRLLLRGAAEHLIGRGCRSAFLWVLRDNPSRWFYRRLGGRAVLDAPILVAGQEVVQTAFIWDPIEQLLAASKLES